MKIRLFPRINFVKRWLPDGLLARSLMIIITPVLLLQIITSFIFIERHWTAMSNRMNYAVTGEIALLIEQIERAQDEVEIENTITRFADHLELYVTVDENLKRGKSLDSFVPPWMTVEQSLADTLRISIENELAVFRDREDGKLYTVLIWLNDGRGLRILLPERRLFSSTSYIFILWLLGSSFVLFTVAAVFMRNQIRPIRRLAMAAERLGRGLDVSKFKPQGAREVRQASRAFVDMKDRLKRQIEQRTAMLSGVSHDLRTPLTRMKLQLELLGDSPDVEAMRQDVTDMERMIEGYLAFARGEGDEAPHMTDVTHMIEKLAGDVRRQGADVEQVILPDMRMRLRPQAMERALANIINNAFKYGQGAVFIAMEHVQEKGTHAKEWLNITVEDNGQGLPEEALEDVFKPFFRMDKSRNSKTGGVGLGLSIAQDVIHSHGGDITLGQSQSADYGGLRVVVRLPL